MFEDRIDAAQQLVAPLMSFQKESPVILALPRGGVPMGKVIADHLGAPLDVVLVRKLRHPTNKEYAIGSIDETGHRFFPDPNAASFLSEKELEEEASRQLALIRERRQRYFGDREPIPLEGKTVILVDDGVATGSTLVAACHSVRAQNPAKIVIAVGVGAPSSIEMLRSIADEVISLHIPSFFQAVGQFYKEFDQVSDDEVVELLRSCQ